MNPLKLVDYAHWLQLSRNSYTRFSNPEEERYSNKSLSEIHFTRTIDAREYRAAYRIDERYLESFPLPFCPLLLSINSAVKRDRREREREGERSQQRRPQRDGRGRKGEREGAGELLGRTIILRPSSLCLHRGYARAGAHYLVYVTKTSARVRAPAQFRKSLRNNKSADPGPRGPFAIFNR